MQRAVPGTQLQVTTEEASGSAQQEHRPEQQFAACHHQGFSIIFPLRATVNLMV